MNEGEFRNYHRLLDEHAGADLCDDGDVAERARKIGETNDGLSRPSKFEYDAWEAVTS